MRNAPRLLPLLASLSLPALGCSGPGEVGARASATIVSGTFNGYSYKLFVPSGYASGTATPLVLMLHGCLQGADDFAAATGMNKVAEEKGFLVVYPEQKTTVNPARCWQWWDSASHSRGGGEGAMLAGLVQKIAASYTVDGARTYVAGFSAGGGLAAIVAATYPDVYAAAAVSSGLEYRAATDVATSFAAMRSGGPDPKQQGRLAYQAMGPRARPVPVLVFHGTGDGTVAPVNGNQALSQWAQTDDLADDGADNDSVDDVAEDTQMGRVTGGRSFTRTRYADGGGRYLLEKYLIDGMSHAWPAGPTGGGGSYSDKGGPDGARLAWEFFSGLGGGGGTDGGGGADGGSGADGGGGSLDQGGPVDLRGAPDQAEGDGGPAPDLGKPGPGKGCSVGGLAAGADAGAGAAGLLAAALALLLRRRSGRSSSLR